jgi:hypothetical protein
MARARRKQGVQVDAGEEQTIVKSMPSVCPVCGGSSPNEMPTHLQTHAPVERCHHCGDQHTGWKVDWDLVKYPRPDMSLFYCLPCGKYASVNTKEGVS